MEIGNMVVIVDPSSEYLNRCGKIVEKDESNDGNSPIYTCSFCAGDDTNSACDNTKKSFGQNQIKRIRIFISGPCRGIPKYNFPKFDEIEKRLTDAGFEVVNPTRISRKFKECDVLENPATYDKMVQMQIEAMSGCDSILLLDSWEKSAGAILELKMALERNMNVLIEKNIRPNHAGCLEKPFSNLEAQTAPLKKVGSSEH